MCNSVYLILWKVKLFLRMQLSKTKVLVDSWRKEIYRTMSVWYLLYIDFSIAVCILSVHKKSNFKECTIFCIWIMLLCLSKTFMNINSLVLDRVLFAKLNGNRKPFSIFSFSCYLKGFAHKLFYLMLFSRSQYVI